jgi:hypothetical protein
MNSLARVHRVAELAGRPLVGSDDLVVTFRAAELVDRGVLPLAALAFARREALLATGIAMGEATLRADAEAIGVRTRLGRRRLVGRSAGLNGTVEILEREPCSDRLLRAVLADGPLPPAGLRTVAQAIGIDEFNLETAAARVGVVEQRTARTGRRTWELPTAGDAEHPQREPLFCGHPTMWRATNGPWRCTTCHGPASAHLVSEGSPLPELR